jgi:hypothetical protein
MDSKYLQVIATIAPISLAGKTAYVIDVRFYATVIASLDIFDTISDF